MTKHREADILKESVSATYTNERKCLSSVIFCSFTYSIHIRISYCKNKKNILYVNASCIKKSNYGIRYLINERYLQFIYKKAPVSCLILLRLNTEALIYRVNCQWNSLDKGSDYSSFSPGVEVSSLTDATCLLRLDDCREAELVSLLSVPLNLPPPLCPHH